ncbi:MAG: hypothetical protein ACRDKW_15880 [Actinomycetota bacterium]
MARWSPKLSRGLWGLVQRSVREGAGIADVRDAAARAGETPDAPTLSHLYSRAVAGEAMVRAEARYRGSVDRGIYLNRRPSGQNIAALPTGFSLLGRYRQVVQVFGTDPLTGAPTSAFVNVQFDRLLTRGEAIDLALGAVGTGTGYNLTDVEDAEYHATWRRA